MLSSNRLGLPIWKKLCYVDAKEGAIQVLRNAFFQEIGPPPTPS